MEKVETSDAITDSVDRYARDEERKAVERAVAHVERIRQMKLEVHKSALKEIENIKVEAQKKHDEIKEKDESDKESKTSTVNDHSTFWSCCQSLLFKNDVWLSNGQELFTKKNNCICIKPSTERYKMAY